MKFSLSVLSGINWVSRPWTESETVIGFPVRMVKVLLDRSEWGWSSEGWVVLGNDDSAMGNGVSFVFLFERNELCMFSTF